MELFLSSELCYLKPKSFEWLHLIDETCPLSSTNWKFHWFKLKALIGRSDLCWKTLFCFIFPWFPWDSQCCMMEKLQYCVVLGTSCELSINLLYEMEELIIFKIQHWKTFVLCSNCFCYMNLFMFVRICNLWLPTNWHIRLSF